MRDKIVPWLAETARYWLLGGPNIKSEERIWWSLGKENFKALNELVPELSEWG